ncbi:phage antirepressor KilAC domain-containing protein [Delftia tsuruhatensis]|uniref:phage antirepressor KilAC domain-containing protein n=1 Tax=Delftia tsuruhatensis TaxID=180282 RepID=UPI002443AA33|nr:phage antirepressor KilAC domain-containing protein [Delftia tsuruhatensis]MDH0774757.1 phage antirepressor KilAC domain-containing protein [Delftia tsuruhatensis]MDH1458757.1 phage antirepressor KilAC domain-containing protein [Delftia tsuruhatensis]MDH1826901.1 phage antirepressor KilAC domain-containing protein [Delftia tsuruhatensis]WGG09436.1 phage antirepressor KilAC domain-containing protein [Delftia tsuruhatensis]
MNAITAISAAVLTMSSEEIATLVESRHDNVKTSIERLGARGVIQLPALQEVRNHLGQAVSVYQLCKRDSYVVVAQLSPEFTARLVDRWQELEAQAAPAVPRTMSQALRLAAEQAEQIEQQQAALALAAPKAEYVDRYVAANGAKGFRQVAKLLGANEHEFRAWLQDEKIMYRLGGEWTAHQCHIDAGRFVVKTGVAQANEHAFNTTKFTPKGVNWVAGLWGQHQARLAQGERA